MQNKIEPSIFLKIKSEHSQVISSKIPNSFRGARDLVVFGEFLKVWKTEKSRKIAPSHP